MFESAVDCLDGAVGCTGIKVGEHIFMKRLSIIYALTLGRRGIILDEPTNGLNDEIVERFLTTLREYRSTRTWVSVTHDQRVRAIADNVVMLE